MSAGRRPRRLLGRLAQSWLVGALVVQSDAGASFTVSLVVLGTALLLVLAWLVTLAVAASRAWRASERERRLDWATVPAVIALAVVANLLALPLTAHVWIAGPALVRAAPSLAALPPADLRETGARVGFFRVREIESADDEIHFITAECGLLDTCGLAFSPHHAPVRRGEDTFTHLFGPWWHLYRSW